MDRFDVIFSKVFTCSKKAIVYCQNISRLCGFSVRIRTSKTTSIYIVCSREGQSDSTKEQSKKRSRLSDRCNCDWKIVLYKRAKNHWEFRSGKTSEHNHVIYSSEEILDVEDKTNLFPIVPQINASSDQSSSSSPLPSIKSLKLPRLIFSSGSSNPKFIDGNSSDNYSSDSSNFESQKGNYKLKELDNKPPLTRALPKIMSPYEDCPLVPEERRHPRINISFLLN